MKEKYPWLPMWARYLAHRENCGMCRGGIDMFRVMHPKEIPSFGQTHPKLRASAYQRTNKEGKEASPWAGTNGPNHPTKEARPSQTAAAREALAESREGNSKNMPPIVLNP